MMTSFPPAPPSTNDQLSPIRSSRPLLRILQDPYYLGLARYKDRIYDGRHEALVDGDLFTRVQEVVGLQSTGERKRTHHHYLKGSLFCGRCHDGDEAGWITMANVTGRGGHYQYFFCRRTQEKLCNARYMQIGRIEEAVEKFWMTLQAAPEFIAALHRGLRQTVESDQKATRTLHRQLTENLAKLEAQEENLVTLAADGVLPRDTVQKRMTAIAKQRAVATSKLENVEKKLVEVLSYIDACATLLERPGELYRDASDETRRALNQAVFTRIYVDEDEVGGADLKEPFGMILEAGELYKKGTPANRGASASDNASNIEMIARGDSSRNCHVVGPVGLELGR